MQIETSKHICGTCTGSTVDTSLSLRQPLLVTCRTDPIRVTLGSHRKPIHDISSFCIDLMYKQTVLRRQTNASLLGTTGPWATLMWYCRAIRPTAARIESKATYKLLKNLPILLSTSFAHLDMPQGRRVLSRGFFFPLVAEYAYISSTRSGIVEGRTSKFLFLIKKQLLALFLVPIV